MSDLKVNLEDLEVKIEQYPLAQSKHLIEQFLILGYENSIKQEKIINIVKSNIISRNNFNEINSLKEVSLRFLPSVISSTTPNDSSITLIDNNILISYAFPIPPTAYYCSEKILNNIIEPKIEKVPFENIHDETYNIGYAYCFYEKEIVNINDDITEDKKNIVFFIPKAFLIMSQYNYFYTFHKICENLHRQFLSDKVEVPIELQIYNMVNFVPCPLNNNLNLSLFPIELSNLKKCTKEEDYIKLDKNLIFMEQVGGYKHIELNFCKILEILSPEIITQMYLLFFCGRSILLFSKNKEDIQFVLLTFYNLIFPLAHKETGYTLNPNKYYIAEGEEIDIFLFSFLASYSNIDQYDPMPKDQKTNFLIFDQEKKAERRETTKKKFRGEFVLDIDNKLLTLYEETQQEDNKSKGQKKEEDQIDDEFEEIDVGENKQINQLEVQKLKFLFNYIANLLKSDTTENESLDGQIRELHRKLKVLLEIIQKDKKYSTYFVEDKDVKMISLQIQESFLRFNVGICHYFFSKFSEYKGEIIKVEDKTKKTKEELGITDIEYIFFDFFQSMYIRDILMNLVGGYNSTEPKIPKAARRGFDNLLAMVKFDDNKNTTLIKEHYIDILDCIYKKIGEEETKSLTFYEFYKFYGEKLTSYFYYNINEDFADKKIVKENQTNRYYYKYKKIDLDQEIILKFRYFLEDVPKETQDKIFLTSENNFEVLKMTNTRNIYDAYEYFMIKSKILSFKNILQFCILNVVILTTSDLKLCHFNSSIYSLIRGMNFGIRKYVELILNISLRVLVKMGNKNMIIANKYFDVYNVGMEEKQIFPNDELIVLKKEIEKYLKTLTDQGNPEKSELVEKIINLSYEELFSINRNSNSKNSGNEDLISEGKIEENLTLSSGLLEEKSLSSDFYYYPLTLYKKLNELVDKYYKNLCLEDSDLDTFNLLLMNLIFYVNSSKISFPQGTQKFLFYCLCKGKK